MNGLLYREHLGKLCVYQTHEQKKRSKKLINQLIILFFMILPWVFWTFSVDYSVKDDKN